MLSQIPVLEDALRTNRARVVRVQSERVVEFEEEEDEGSCYAFECDADAVAVVNAPLDRLEEVVPKRHNTDVGAVCESIVKPTRSVIEYAESADLTGIPDTE